jgi:tetratricopeptide (TPR) repeat protein
MLTGRLPFRGEYEQAMMYSIVNEEPEPITGLRANVPMELERVVKKALQKDRTNRYQHVNELLADLKSPTKALASEPARVVKEKLPKRKRIFLYGGMAAFFILLSVVGLYFFLERGETIDSIAVLPLANLSGDSNKEFFADGMTEALISNLGQIEALRVISRTSVMQYKNLMKPLPEIAIDPNFAPAYAELALPYMLLGIRKGGLPAGEAESKARQAAAKALQLDQMNAEAHAALGVLRQAYDWDWSGAEEEFRQAIELNPGSRASHFEYGLFLIRMGKTEEGLAEVKRAQEVDPLSEITNVDVAWAYIYNRQYDQAIEQCKKTLTFFPNSAQTQFKLGQACLLKGMYEEAIIVLETEVVASLGSPDHPGFLGYAHALSGHRDKSLKIFEKLQVQPKRWKGLIECIAMIYTGLGEKDEALTWLERAYDERSPVLLHLIQHPIFDPLRSELRFQALLKKMRLEK